jgi:hypothetical protein
MGPAELYCLTVGARTDGGRSLYYLWAMFLRETGAVFSGRCKERLHAEAWAETMLYLARRSHLSKMRDALAVILLLAHVLTTAPWQPRSLCDIFMIYSCLLYFVLEMHDIL